MFNCLTDLSIEFLSIYLGTSSHTSDAGEERSFELARHELHKAELTQFLTVAMETNRDSVGTPEDVTEFLASKA